ncbi:MAG: (d)CMP kinase [Candidatus Hydrogenedentes bacterium]|nr:(d)CMP kinase [Candidatus Hydrogenedentota bacterium]
MNSLTQIIAIDGPAGAGKSTVARKVAEAMNFAFLDTGAMYRAATWWALEQRIDLDDPVALAEATRSMQLDLNEEEGVLRVRVNGHDITDAIRTPEVTRQIYRLDQNAQVREHLVELQRVFGGRGPTVAEGRDMGTVVFPKARCKVFLDASLDERTRRRAAELAAKGVAIDLDALKAEIHERDEKTRTRAVAPLRRADDAALVDTTRLTIEQAVDAIVHLARTRL